MMSLNKRILLSATLVLLIFIVGIALALDRAFHDSARLGVQDRMLARVLMLMGDAEVDEDGRLEMPTNLLDTEFSRPNAGTYAYIIDQSRTIVWQSTSALNKKFPELILLDKGVRDFGQIDINSQASFIYRYGVAWATEAGNYPLTFNVITDTALFDAQIERYREDLWGWLSVMTVLLLITQMLVLRWGLQPMRRVSAELSAIESGAQENVNGVYPSELKLLTDSINSLINHERKQQKRYRNGLADLAHSLKTPLAVLQGAATAGNNEPDKEKTIREQIERMDNIIQYQLRRAATAGSSPGMRLVVFYTVADRIVRTVRKAYHDKDPEISMDIDQTISLRIDEGDLMELLGNLVDNAFKWCDRLIVISARQYQDHVLIQVKDDGPGIRENEITRILERGVRADQSIPGHGIGLAIVRDIIQVYGGNLFIEKNHPVGACVTIALSNR
ncbi:MAG: ATP-binding protein [Nitrosomonas sp.]|nr:GHKL domain-containing protein [Nitrosomonas sp.]MCP5250303.1 GHKL domain-containing protein [Burkholderiales bacterium]MCP5292032.1 GHKL domain-containing protein [Burkholderiales bacterium]MDR4520269.1 ATP-binding protein [Nitrosomonas sp.]HQU61893.1 ATP-binding protein [Nitrosomonas sp.]